MDLPKRGILYSAVSSRPNSQHTLCSSRTPGPTCLSDPRTRLFLEATSSAQFLCRIDYTKKKDKRAQIKAMKDETVPRDDVYKSHTIHVPSGEPPNSLSRPPAKRKEGVVRPIKEGKLLRAGGPSKVRSSITIILLETYAPL